MSCITRDNILILLEVTLIKTNHLYAEIKYRSESERKQIELETYVNLLLTDDIGEKSSEIFVSR